MMQSKIIACFLCLTLLMNTVGAQERQLLDSDHLKKKIEEVESAAPKSETTSVNLTYKRTLLRRYSQYAASLLQDIEDLRKIRATLDSTDSDGIKEIDADIERLTKEHETANEKAKSLRDELQESVVTQPLTSPAPRMEAAQLPCPCQQIEKDKLPPGTIWCEETAKTDKLNVQDLAERAAPILWFSPDEPLLKVQGKPIPELLPGDDPADSSVVYYRISNLVLDPSIPISDRDKGFKFNRDPVLKLKEIKGLTLKYYFYYSKDTGFNGHTHDLESVAFDIQFTTITQNNDKTGTENPSPSKETSSVTYYVARISRIVGAAHAVSWFYNQLDIKKDTSLPITLLVEEGKHATCPDRNADGSYSPGYDVNRRFNDAWGVRDIIGTGEVGGVRYEGSMTKPRRPHNMIMVRSPEARRECLLSFYSGPNKEMLRRSQVYQLRLIEPQLVERVRQGLAALKVETNQTELKVETNQKTIDLLGIMKREKFDEDEPLKTHQASIFKRAIKFGLGIEHSEDAPDALTLSYRYDGGHGFSFSPPIGRFQVPVFGGFLLPKANLILFGKDKRYSLEAMYTPSAARSFDWYASIGSEWFRPEGLDVDTKFVSEGGIKFRFPKKKLFGIMPLGARMFGARLGLRTTGRDPRVIFEFGAGAF